MTYRFSIAAAIALLLVAGPELAAQSSPLGFKRFFLGMKASEINKIIYEDNWKCEFIDTFRLSRNGSAHIDFWPRYDKHMTFACSGEGEHESCTRISSIALSTFDTMVFQLAVGSSWTADQDYHREFASKALAVLTMKYGEPTRLVQPPATLPKSVFQKAKSPSVKDWPDIAVWEWLSGTTITHRVRLYLSYDAEVKGWMTCLLMEDLAAAARKDAADVAEQQEAERKKREGERSRQKVTRPDF